MSRGWASPCGVHPTSLQNENAIIKSMTLELNGLFSLDLCTKPIHDRLIPAADEPGAKKALVIGGSHTLREGNILDERGYNVISCAVGGWRPNKGACEDMVEKVTEALSMLSPTDIIVIHCFDNVWLDPRREGPAHQKVL